MPDKMLSRRQRRSSSPAQRTTTSSPPPDPGPSYDTVAKDILSFKGKRVKWLAFIMTAKSPEGIMICNIQKEPEKSFVVKMVPNFDIMSYPMGQEIWVSGEVGGVENITATITSPGGKRKEVARDVPLLTSPEFQVGAGK